MKILAVNKFYYIYGGADRYFFELNDLLARHGHEVIPFSMQHPSNRSTPYSRFFVSHVSLFESGSLKEHLRSAGRILYSSEARRKIGQLVRETQPDIAHLHLIYHHLSPSILPALKAAGIPIVQTLHDYKPICPTYSMVANGAICERCKGRRFYQAALVRCNRGSLSASLLNSIEMYLHYALGYYTKMISLYITPSDFMRRKLIEFGMNPEQIVHVPNFVDPKQYAYSETHGNYFAYIGRLVPIKGVMTLLKAMRGVKGAELYVIGEGQQRAELEQAACEWKLDNVRFLGYRSGQELEDLRAGAMFTVMPSEWYENCPLSVLESMVQGKPVVGARIGGIPELIEEGQNGLLFTPGDADELRARIERLIHNADERRRFGEAARQKIVAQYNPELHYQRIMEVYKRVL